MGTTIFKVKSLFGFIRGPKLFQKLKRSLTIFEIFNLFCIKNFGPCGFWNFVFIEIRLSYDLYELCTQTGYLIS